MKDESRQEYIERINRVIDHISEHFDTENSLADLADIACFSEYHFHRIFRAMMGETIGEFTGRMRMERAVALMRRSRSANLSRIAIECGFNSVSNFSRAFKKRYGVSPSRTDLDELSQDSKIGKDYPTASRYYFKPFPEDELALDFEVKIEQRADLHLAYIRTFGLYLEPQKGMDAYARLMDWVRQNKELLLDDRVIGMSPDDPEVTPLEKCRYDLCVALNQPMAPQGEIGCMLIPASNYAVHHCAGDITAFERAWSYFFKVWFPSSGYVPDSMPAMEIFHSRPEDVGWEYFDIDCCVPIKPLWR